MTARIIVFAKAPVPGAVKTRLAPALGPAGAARLHERLVARTLETATAAGADAVELCCAPDAAHPFFAGCAARHGVALAEQGEGDLGERMYRALRRANDAGALAVLIGADCPAFTAAYLTAAAHALDAGCDAALGPAADGGYVLVATRDARSAMFDGVAWSRPDVLVRQRAAFAALGWRWHELAALWDVDRPEDVARLRRMPDGAALLDGLGNA